MKHKIASILIGHCFLVMTSCNTFNGQAAFVNLSDRNVTVYRTLGFEREPPCGYLMVGTHKSSGMDRMHFPTNVTIIWSYYQGTWESDDIRTNTVDLSDITPPQANELTVRFTFSEKYRWLVDVVDYGDLRIAAEHVLAPYGVPGSVSEK